MTEPLLDVVIIGAGPAGYTAALYAARSGLKTLVFAGAPSLEHPERLLGGQLVSTTRIENFPGFPEGIDGRDLMERMRAQAELHGAEVREENVSVVETTRYPYRVLGDAGSLQTRALVIATGAASRWLGVEGEDTYRQRGVFACATCDGPLFVDAQVSVVGGGDTALEEALYLARFARHVHVVHRRRSLRASRVMIERARANPKINFVWNSRVERVLGDGERVTGLALRDVESGVARELASDAVFVAIGHTPESSLFGPELARDAAGYVITQPRSTQTSLAGVFACGDVADPTYRQAITAAGSGAMAALDVQHWLMEQTSLQQSQSAA